MWISYIIGLDSLDESHEAWQGLFKVIMDGSNFRHCEDSIVPGSDGNVIVKGDFVDEQVGDFVEDLEISNSEMVTSNEGSLSVGKSSLKSLQTSMHLFFSLLQILGCQLLASFQLSMIFEQNDAQSRGSEAGLSPSKVLVHDGLALRGGAVILAELFGEGLAKVNKDGIALSKLEISMRQKWNHAMWILAEILRALGLPLQQLHIDELRFNFSDVNGGLGSSGRLADQVPIQRKHNKYKDMSNFNALIILSHLTYNPATYI